MATTLNINLNPYIVSQFEGSNQYITYPGLDEWGSPYNINPWLYNDEFSGLHADPVNVPDIVSIQNGSIFSTCSNKENNSNAGNVRYDYYTHSNDYKKKPKTFRKKTSSPLHSHTRSFSTSIA